MPRPPLALAPLFAAVLFLVGCGTEEPETEETTAATPTSVAGPSTSLRGPLIELPQAVEAATHAFCIVVAPPG